MPKSELIDLVNSSGHIVKTNVERDDAAHYDGLHMQIVIAVIRNAAGKYLVHQRAHTKKVNPGDIDHVCGGMHAGETPEATTEREAKEEGGVHITEAKVVHAGVNEYNRWRYLVTAYTDDEPDITLTEPSEVAAVGFYSYDELKAKQQSGEFTFVDGFFEDIELANN
jgi:8-oxo-dGTP pyrophosphatase MutT (NUDIX family)